MRIFIINWSGADSLSQLWRRRTDYFNPTLAEEASNYSIGAPTRQLPHPSRWSARERAGHRARGGGSNQLALRVGESSARV